MIFHIYKEKNLQSTQINYTYANKNKTIDFMFV